ncbi:methionyl-tRNA formyltransferase, mitochondrial isoform X2 [Latimeria chalumnae]|uniref:methionyl-tRNA formyltransferase, mitochondrial isoform X2 n=1 Tax=Latimeria chalumnae TaxID=7897 RepID=UPI0003C172FC|nr:PREDICTED: methionyl-tRNA formyltransferase, mitochondrial isoform X2 [Latimeria chalumnae]|eukprot:XP_005990185.1 PREDICTED: methionyl-tRNA formyltransferase, mitochondrial isoform X2 [Latimeria chalumnae]
MRNLKIIGRVVHQSKGLIPSVCGQSELPLPQRHLTKSLWHLRACPSSPSHERQNNVRKKPPWRIMFFGTDAFAVESLNILNKSRDQKTERLVEKLEVVTLPSPCHKELPVRKYASENQIPVRVWPDVGPCDQFDVGVVVSFGRLLSDDLINKFSYGMLNVHPSLLPRWRGSAPVFHTVLQGDPVTGVTIMQIRPKRFDIGPILMQQECSVPPQCTAEELGAILAKIGAELLLSTLKNLPDRIKNKKEQPTEGVTFDYDLKSSKRIPGSLWYHKASKTLLVLCKDDWVGIRAVMLKKKLSAADFYNGYLGQYSQQNSEDQGSKWHFQIYKPKTEEKKKLKRKAGL